MNKRVKLQSDNKHLHLRNATWMGRVNVIPVVGDGKRFWAEWCSPMENFFTFYCLPLLSGNSINAFFSSTQSNSRVANARRGILLLFALTRTLRECVIASGSLTFFRCGPEGKKLIFSACWMLPSNEKDVYVGCSIRSFSHLGLPAYHLVSTVWNQVGKENMNL